MKLSIVVGVRNRNLQMVHFLNSLLNQDKVNELWEIVVVDYGGDKGLTSIINKQPFTNLRYIYVKENGIYNESRAKNIGIKSAQGEVILCTNADIIFSSDVIKKLIQQLTSNSKRCLYQLRRHDLKEEVIPLLSGFKNGVYKFQSNQYEIGPDSAYGDFQAMTKENWFKLHGYDERMTGWGYMDIDLYRRAKRLGIQRNWLSEKTYKLFHQYHPLATNRQIEANTAISRNQDADWELINRWGEIEAVTIIYLGYSRLVNQGFLGQISRLCNASFPQLRIEYIINRKSNPQNNREGMSQLPILYIHATTEAEYLSKTLQFLNRTAFDYFINFGNISHVRAGIVQQFFSTRNLFDIWIYNTLANKVRKIVDKSTADSMLIINSKAALLLNAEPNVSRDASSTFIKYRLRVKSL